MKLRESGSGLGFSLVEVAVAGAVLGTAAVMLSAAMSTSNAQKHISRRQALARSVVLRQLEHYQAKIDESFRPGNTVNVAGAFLRMNQLRPANEIRIDRLAASANQFEVQPMLDLERQPVAARFQLLPGNEFHLFGGGGLTAAELARINNEQIGMNVFVATVRTQSLDQSGILLPPDTVYGYVGEVANMTNLDLQMVQVSAFDSAEVNLRFFALSRIFRVPTQALFPPVPGVGARGKF